MSYFRRLKNSGPNYVIPRSFHSDQDYAENLMSRDEQDYDSDFHTNVNTKDFSDATRKRPWLKTYHRSISENAPEEEQIIPRSVEYLSPEIKFGNNSLKTSDKNSLSDNNCGIYSSRYIVGGRDAAEGAHPWIAVLLNRGGILCSAVIINKDWLITAAHAFEFVGTGANGKTVGVGSNDRTKGKIYKIDKIIVHQSYDKLGFKESDIALMRVDTPIQFGTNVRPICLPEMSYQQVKSMVLVLAGWGFTQYGYNYNPINLKELKLNVFPIERCAQKYQNAGYRIFKSQICTFNQGEDACQVDSGGPLIENINGKATLVGIVSFGVTCADEYPGVFTKVSYFLNWIQLNMMRNAPR